MDVCAIPFNRQLGLKLIETHSGNAISLQPAASHLNHLGTVHAGVVFSVAEAASGQALVDRFPHLTRSAIPVLRGSTTKYRKPATSNEVLSATAKIADETAEIFEQQLTERGRALIEVHAAVRQAEAEVLRGTFAFFVTMASR